MGWVDILRGSKVAVDTMPLIYFVEEHPIYLQVVDPCFEAIERGEFSVITSTVSLLEGLVHPIRNNDAELIEKYHNLLFDTEGISTIDLTQAIAKEAAQLRAFHNIRTPDAIPMATASFARASFFLTNDRKLPSLPGMQTLVLDDLKGMSDDQQKVL